MNTSTISSKYQIVIPKELRKQLSIKPGQTVYLSSRPDGVLVQTTSRVEKLYGSMEGAWGSDSEAYLRGLRDEANRNRT